MLNILYTTKVKKDLIEIQQYIARDSIYYAMKVIESIQTSVIMLSKFPKIGKKIDETHHMIIDKNYGYKIVYKVKNNTVIIMGVFKYQNSWQ